MLSAYATLVEDAQNKIAEESDRGNEYAQAVATYLGLGVGKLADYNCVNVTWIYGRDQAGHAFTKHAMPFIWDYVEVNPFAGAAGDFEVSAKGIAKAIDQFPAESSIATVAQINATQIACAEKVCISSDPPYYDNVPYADLSDFFYVWLRKALSHVYPDFLSTVLVPKSEELVADQIRHEGRDVAKQFFEDGMLTLFSRLNEISQPDYPATIYYAFKQIEEADGEGSSTGWETMLHGLVKQGWEVVGTWPMRTERAARGRSQGANALASSIVLVCRPREEKASRVTRRDFANALRKELPEAIKHLQSGNVAPVDLAQASIGPGMAVFSRYSKVVNADGSPMSVREALQLINQVLDESLVEQESDFDAETRFALRWFEQYGMTEGPFGDAETLAKAMAVAVSGVVECRHRQKRGRESSAAQPRRTGCRLGPDKPTPG